MSDDNGFKIKWPLIIGILLLITILSGGITFFFKTRSNTEEKGFTINPKVQLNPKKKYQITYWDYDLFIGRKDKYKDFLEQSINEFKGLYPNIKVNYKILSFSGGEEKLKKALEEGNPPDIYHDIFAKRLIDKKLQIPVNLLFEEGERGKYSQTAIKSFLYDKKIWGLPDWILPQLWVGNKKLLAKTNLNLEKVVKEGWSWDEFYQTALEIKKINRDSSIIFNPYNSELFYQLLANSTDESSILDTFSFLDKLRKEKVFPVNTKSMNKKLLPYFWQGKAGIIAPVNLWLLNNLYLRDEKEREVELTLLPVPTKGGIKPSLKSTGLLLFRQEDYQGDEHSKAVYQFAQFMNQQKNLLLTKKLNVVPAYLPLQSIWRMESSLKENVKKQILESIKRSNYRTLNNKNEFKKIINKNYQLFWLKEFSASTVLDKIFTDKKVE